MHKAVLCFVLSVLLSYHSSSAFQPLISRTAAFNHNLRHRARIELRGGGAPTMAATKPEKIVICGGGIQGAAIAYYLRCRYCFRFEGTATTFPEHLPLIMTRQYIYI